MEKVGQWYYSATTQRLRRTYLFLFQETSDFETNGRFVINVVLTLQTEEEFC